MKFRRQIFISFYITGWRYRFSTINTMFIYFGEHCKVSRKHNKTCFTLLSLWHVPLRANMHAWWLITLFQWQLNGVTLTGIPSPMVALNGIHFWPSSSVTVFQCWPLNVRCGKLEHFDLRRERFHSSPQRAPSLKPFPSNALELNFTNPRRGEGGSWSQQNANEKR